MVPADAVAYWVEFQPDGALLFQADCNRGHGRWTQRGSEVKLEALVTTLMACPEGSLDSRFSAWLSQVTRLEVQGRTLKLRLPGEGGRLRFRRTSAVPH